jgi:hypothetical protein
LVTVETAEISELTRLGVGTGVGEGVGVGVGIGVGLGDWAWADDTTTTARMTAKTTVSALAKLRPVPVSFDRESRDEQHINAIPKRSASSTNTHKIRSIGTDLPPVLEGGQPVLVRRHRRLAAIVVPLPQVASAIPRLPQPRPKLANTQFSCCNIGHNRI